MPLSVLRLQRLGSASAVELEPIAATVAKADSQWRWKRSVISVWLSTEDLAVSSLLRQGSVSIAPASGLLATAQVVRLHWWIDAVFAAPLSTVGRVLKALGLGRLKNLQPAEPVRRYQWAQPSDTIHVDTYPQASAKQ